MPIYRFVDTGFFKTWSPDMAYALGFLFADGTITITARGTQYVAFHSNDRYVLQSITDAMCATQKISLRSSRSGKVYRLQIGSKQMVQDLLSLGLTIGKARQMNFPKVPQQCIADCIRGYFDGDGNVWVGNNHTARSKSSCTISVAFTSASHDFLSGLLRKLRRLGVEGGSLYPLSGKQCWRLGFGKQDSLKLYEIMYNTDASDMIYLKRKKRVFEEFLQTMRT